MLKVLKPQSVALDDKYTLEKGQIYLTGIQALVRLLLMQHERDARAGLKTAGFVSGYRGSPLGGVDQALWKAGKYLKPRNIHFEPGINEDLAATAVWGTQQIDVVGGSRYDGVFGMWYGKGPGIDRSSDVIKHANAAGTTKNGGVLMVGGDDHACKSSTLPHQSEFAYMDFMTPFLNPAGIQEILDYGLLGWAMSRFTGLWIGLKIVSDTADSSASVLVDPNRAMPVIPSDFVMPPQGLNARGSNWPPVGFEELLHYHKIPAALEFVRVNKLDQIIWNPPKARIGIVSTGKSYLDVRQALFDLGIDEKTAMDLGIRLYKVAMPWPLEPSGVLKFAEGLEEIFVAEEKRDVMEHQVKNILYAQTGNRPRVVGKKDEKGAILLSSIDELSSSEIAVAIAARLSQFIKNDRIENAAREMQKILQSRNPHNVGFNRIPYFCSGCPHNTSTKVPEGSTALAGIGCHIMSLWMDRQTTTVTQMGGEGVTWVGQAPFTDTKHVFSNLGDGTYYHSGLMAIRAAVSANVNITYKILYNDAVAMTGGQPVEGGLSVPQITQQLVAEGVQKVVVVSDHPENYPIGAGFAHGVKIHHRSELDQVQRDLRDHPGVTALIYDQTCAAEKRRRRKRGTFYDPPRRIFINDQVCEGCGDCSVKSNCLSVVPVETEYGRKRAIDQSTCNKDFSCVNGFCPSFVSVIGGGLRKNKSAANLSGADVIPLPKLPDLNHPVSLLINGIGGTGVVTIGALLGMASHIEGKGATVMDMTGLAQKGGSVWSHVRIGKTPQDMYSVRIGAGCADYVLGADLVVTANDDTIEKIRAGKTKILVNSQETVTGNFTRNPDLHFPSMQLADAIKSSAGANQTTFIDASRIATSLLGDSIATNLFMLGHAWQMGWIPLQLESIMQAIELNEVSIAMNQQAFNWGRMAAHDPKSVEKLTKPAQIPPHHKKSETLDEAIDRRAAQLTEYQNSDYAQQYKDAVMAVRRAEQQRVPGQDALSWAAAKYLFKLMAYKDEYEVARLYSNGQFRQQLSQQFGGDYKLQFHLAPPLLAPRDERTGHLQKMTFGPWMMNAFGVLAKFKFLRGTAFDIFGYTAERKMERRLAADYAADLRALIAKLTPENHKMAVEWASIPEKIRGFGHVKESHLEKIHKRQSELRAALFG